MISTPRPQLSMARNLLRRFFRYSAVGMSTFAFDLLLIYVFHTHLHLHEALAVALGFAIAISINFFLSYHLVFSDTTRNQFTGYIIFVSLATLGLLVVLSGTLLVHHFLGISLYLARTIVAGIVGLVNFLINTFFNFRVTLS